MKKNGSILEWYMSKSLIKSSSMLCAQKAEVQAEITKENSELLQHAAVHMNI